MQSLPELALTINQKSNTRFSWIILQPMDHPGVFEHVVLQSQEDYPSSAMALNAGSRALGVLLAEDLDIPRMPSGVMPRGHHLRMTTRSAPTHLVK